jgi:hypothetical protein
VIYRGDIQDTASLVGLAHSRVKVGLVAFIGELTDDSRQYCETISAWLKEKGLPPISLHPSLSAKDFNRIIDRPHIDWGWGTKECKAALRLAGLPLPPTL